MRVCFGGLGGGCAGYGGSGDVDLIRSNDLIIGHGRVCGGVVWLLLVKAEPPHCTTTPFMTH